jgi:hypothetical protein
MLVLLPENDPVVIRFNPEVGTEGATHFKPVLSELSATILAQWDCAERRHNC